MIILRAHSREMLESWKFINQVPLKTLKPATQVINPIKR